MVKSIGKVIQSMSYPTISLDVNEEYILSKDEETLIIENEIKRYASTLKYAVGDVDNRIERAMKYLNDDRVKKLLEIANSNKHQQIWHEQQRLKRITYEQEQRQALIEKCDANYFYRLIKYQSEPERFKIANKDYLKTICFFFSSDKRFETELNFDLNKGLWVRGETGRGKTHPFMCLQENELIPFTINSLLAIAETIAENGSYSITQPLKVIDDVGSEQSVVNHYGTKINWFKHFIELYYAEQKPFNNLIVTTNFDFNEVEKNYGFRVRSRIKDMFNIVDVKGDDLRGR